MTLTTTPFDLVFQTVTEQTVTVKINETAVDRYYRARHFTADGNKYDVDFWDGLPSAIRLVGCGGEMTPGSLRPSWED